MVYTVLQLVARAKETGISAVDVSNKTGYDSKNCAYLIKQLQEMDLVCGKFPHRSVYTSDLILSQSQAGPCGYWRELLCSQTLLRHQPYVEANS